jgi:D-hydroxyproline dehydrogenase subunit beta
MSRPAYDVIILGAGIVGAACARVLAAKNLRVAVVESDIVGGGATAAGMGHVVAMDDSPAQFALTRYSRQTWREFVESLPPDCEYEGCGTLWAAADAEEMAAVFAKKKSYEQAGVRAEVLDAAAMKDAEPHLRPGMAGGLRVPDDFVLYPPCAARWMIEQARAHDAELLLGSAAVKIDDAGVTLADGTRLAAGKIIVAAGTLAKGLLPELPMRPRKGHLVITDRYPGFVRHQIVELGYLKSAGAATGDSVAFNIQPRLTGQLLLGSSRQYDDDSAEVRWPLLRRMIDRALSYMPDLARNKAIRIWTGFRAATPDKLPLIGPYPGLKNVLLATGHEGLGITTAPATAEMIAQHVLGLTPAIPLEPYLPSRLLQEGKI